MAAPTGFGPILLAGIVGLAVAATGLLVASCSSVSNSRIGIDAPPFNPTTFAPVGDYLVWRCGTNDCHGAPGRNFRVYGCDGLRLDSEQSVSCVTDSHGGGPTTNDEYVATYRSMVALEPQLMSTVFKGCNGATGSNGVGAYPPPEACHPELLTMMAKARGIEKHKGGQLICISPPCPPGVPNPNPYDPQDVCLVTWLEGNVDMTACGSATYSYGLPVKDASAE